MKYILPFVALLLQATAQNITTDLSKYYNITTFPNEQRENLNALLAQGLSIAGPDLNQHFIHRCIRSQIYPQFGDGLAVNRFVTPSTPFKDVFFVGQAAWSAWAIETGNRELLIIDTLVSPAEVDAILLPGLEKFGYKGSDIKHIIITHEHTDHFGGLATLQQRFNPIVYASETAWVAMANSSFDPVLYDNYTNARSVTDSQVITINDFAITTYLTPGHTPGTISFTFPVTDTQTNQSHIAGFHGGGGIPRTASAMNQQIASFSRWSQIAGDKGVDVLMSNHQTQDNALYNFDLLAHRACDEGKCGMQNPFVVGVDAYARYAEVMAVCVRVSAARAGIGLEGRSVERRNGKVTDEDCHD